MKRFYKYTNRDTSGIAISSIYIGDQSFHNFYAQLSYFQYSKNLYRRNDKGYWKNICREDNDFHLKLHLIMSLRANKTFIAGKWK